MEINPKRIQEIISHLYTFTAEIIIYPKANSDWHFLRVDSRNEFEIHSSEVNLLIDSEIIEYDGGGENTKIYMMTQNAKEKINELKRKYPEIKQKRLK